MKKQKLSKLSTFACGTIAIGLFFSCGGGNTQKTAAETQKEDSIAMAKIGDIYSFQGENGLYGYSNTKDSIILKAKYKDALNFINNFAIVKDSTERYGIINKLGKTVIDFKYDYISSINNTNTYICEEKNNDNLKMGVVNEKQEVIIPFDYSSITYFKNKFRCRKIATNKDGILSNTGEIIIPFDYDYIDINSVSEGVMSASKNKKYGYIDSLNKVVIDFQYDYAINFSEGLACVKNATNKYGYINIKNEVIIPFEFSYATPFREGLASVSNQSGKYGYIGKDGKIVIPYKYSSAGYFFNGKANVNIDGNKFIYIDVKGNEVK